MSYHAARKTAGLGGHYGNLCLVPFSNTTLPDLCYGPANTLLHTQDFLHAGQVLCIAVDKSGEEERVILPEAHTLSELPLVSVLSAGSLSLRSIWCAVRCQVDRPDLT